MLLNVLLNALIVVLTVVAMEIVSIVAHKHVMHGFGWAWHKSHHEPHHGRTAGWFEKNDLYAVVFAGIAIALIYAGTRGHHPLEWIGAGMTAYGLLYFVAHDGLVHQRWPFRYVPRRGYLKRLYQAHRMHHAVRGKEGAVSFGFLYAPPVTQLKRQLHAQRPRAATTPADESSAA
ncbi:beta-carotene 3-hydroxylase [Pseudoduganella flava]|uniref:Beta-carotene 3-hydroxylase n=1 Tax=Pseudoduganella flava TaxID=871742 RepID=A0A562PLP1_9BURK|nr:sterol desaturase family protein [Pseudoduganella flava]QGZ40976.1 beta-carotene hydroxylase [Pseudoduganella flava]TWI45337.1 beta-carotene 3-hydroxylase [Pseudoduganella flava]